MCVGCGTRRVARRWTYCTICRGRLERGEQVQQEDYPGGEFQRALRVVAPPVPARLELRWGEGRHLEPGDPVRCGHYDCVLPVKVCLQRQDARWPGAGRKAPIYAYCGSGRCGQGAGYRRLTRYLPAEEWRSRSKSRSPRYQSYRGDAGAQRRRMRLQALSRPEGEVPTIDYPPGGPERAPPLDLADLGERQAFAKLVGDGLAGLDGAGAETP